MGNAIHPGAREKFLADWHEAIQDEEALLKDPEAYTQGLIEEASRARAEGVITAEDLRESVEWAGSAQAWAVEEQEGRK